MKKTIVRAVLTTTMLFSMVLGQNVITNAAAVTPVVTATSTATVKPAATPVPIMRDNLSKYGLKKDLELPVTVTAGGLSYTLEKFMIYDFKSKDAQNLVKKYDYDSFGVMVSKPKYLIWTKITIKNNSNKIVKRSLNDQKEKWILSLQGKGQLDQIWPKVNVEKLNNKEAFYYYTLKPSEQLTTYQAYLYDQDFNYFAIRLFHDGGFDEKFIVNSTE
ncbi:hypothetical protein MHH60_17415 [Paenibacillus sp. FSL H7-0716]|uniref:Uncharacterized protein n=1 Tax=Paenibacillus odorifer TaxID=189426 RepID=A0AB36J817_9BACL|nr:hypothetical protein [Paenibacillus odorifer]OME14542.1 hypothetical protein BSK47_23640 [Paenibacillus odorifer]